MSSNAISAASVGSSNSARTITEEGCTGPPMNSGSASSTSSSICGTDSPTVVSDGRFSTSPSAPSSVCSTTSTTVRQKLGSSSAGPAISSCPRTNSIAHAGSSTGPHRGSASTRSGADPRRRRSLAPASRPRRHPLASAVARDLRAARPRRRRRRRRGRARPARRSPRTDPLAEADLWCPRLARIDGRETSRSRATRRSSIPVLVSRVSFIVPASVGRCEVACLPAPRGSSTCRPHDTRNL